MSAAAAESLASVQRGSAKTRHGFRAVAQSIASKALILGLQAATGILTARALRPWGRGELAAWLYLFRRFR